MAQRTSLAVAAAVFGILLLFLGLGIVGPRPPGDGGGGNGGGTTTTTTPYSPATLDIKALNVDGSIFTLASISVNDQLKGYGHVTLEVQPITSYRITFGEVSGYYTPDPVTVYPIPGERVEVVGRYYPKTPTPTTYMLTVLVEQCNPFDGSCSPLRNADVEVDDGQKGRTGDDGKITFRVLPGQRTVKAWISGIFIGERTVDVQSDTSVNIVYWVWFSLTGFPGIDWTTILIFAILAALIILVMRRRRAHG